jgi:hypothetical protein
VATNLRLRSDAEEAVRREAQRTGRSQQDVIRDAIDRHLGLSAASGGSGELDVLITSGAVRRPRSPYRKATKRLQLPGGTSSIGLLDRDDRI